MQCWVTSTILLLSRILAPPLPSRELVFKRACSWSISVFRFVVVEWISFSSIAIRDSNRNWIIRRIHHRRTESIHVGIPDWYPVDVISGADGSMVGWWKIDKPRVEQHVSSIRFQDGWIFLRRRPPIILPSCCCCCCCCFHARGSHVWNDHELIGDGWMSSWSWNCVDIWSGSGVWIGFRSGLAPTDDETYEGDGAEQGRPEDAVHSGSIGETDLQQDTVAGCVGEAGELWSVEPLGYPCVDGQHVCRQTIRARAVWTLQRNKSNITLHYITLHYITSHHITSHHITSHHITSHHITSHHITSHHITSHHKTSHHITSHHITLHHITLNYMTLHDITWHYIALHYITLHYITSHHITSHYITLHHITSHYITLHHITSHYITLHHITSHYITLHHITSHYITLHHITSHYITLHHITSHYITLHHITSHYITLHHITSHYITLHHITSHYITLHHITSHYITLHHITLHYIALHYITSHYITIHHITLHHITLH